MGYKTWVLALIGLCAAMPAWADEDEGADDGPYVYVQAGKALAYNGCQSGWITTALPAVGTNPNCSEWSPIYRAGFGYQYTSIWGVEVNYGTFGNASADGTAMIPGFATPSGYSWQLKAAGLAVQAVATVHLSDSLAVIGRAGAARVEFTEYMYSWNASLPAGYTNYYWLPVVNTTRVAPALGAGLRYDVGQHGSIFLIGETFGSHQIYDMYGSAARVRLVSTSLGLMYRY